MTRLGVRGLWGCAAAALLASGCVLAPGVDPEWRTLKPERPDDRLVYARSRQVEIGRNVWVGRAVAAVGAGLVATFVAAWQGVEHRKDNVHEISRARRPYAWLGAGAGAVLVAGVGYTGYHEEMRDQWRLMEADQLMRLDGGGGGGGGGDEGTPGGARAPGAGGGVAAPPTGRRLYVAADDAVPADISGVTLVHVESAADPVLAPVAEHLPVLRLPLLVSPGAGGAPDRYAMGWAAVRRELGGK